MYCDVQHELRIWQKHVLEAGEGVSRLALEAGDFNKVRDDPLVVAQIRIAKSPQVVGCRMSRRKPDYLGEGNFGRRRSGTEQRFEEVHLVALPRLTKEYWPSASAANAAPKSG
jgi:hypothetical protein